MNVDSENRNAESRAKPLINQVALVTGATSGIGRAVAIALADAGATVAVNYPFKQERGDAVVDQIARRGGKAIAVRGDVSREDQVEQMFRVTVDRLGRLDILVNNAGLQRDAPIAGMALADWQRVIDVNLTGQFLCARAAVRAFLQQSIDPAISRAAGKIVCISSVHEVIPWAGHVNYAASKGGVALLMRSLALEVAAHKIRVNSIAPGAIKTPINHDAWSTAEAEARLLKLIPYGRIGVVDDIANAAVWLVSDAADYVTGATLFIDGGMTLYPGFVDNG